MRLLYIMTSLIEKVCELDDDLTMMYLEGEIPSIEEIKAAFEKSYRECRAVPVCCGTAYRNKGVQKLLDAIIEYMPPLLWMYRLLRVLTLTVMK